MIAVDESFPEEDLIKLAENTKIPKILALNKIDAVEEAVSFRRMHELAQQVDFVEAIPLSALNGSNVDTLKQLVLNHLPEGPPYFDKDQISDRPERFFVSEIIREKNLFPAQTGIALQYRSGDRYLRGTSQSGAHSRDYSHRKAVQKGMIIGKQGSMLKKNRLPGAKRYRGVSGAESLFKIVCEGV